MYKEKILKALTELNEMDCKKLSNRAIGELLDERSGLHLADFTCRKFRVRYKYKRLMAKLMKSYWHTCNEMAFLQDKAPRRLRLKWAFQQRRIKLYKRYLSIYAR